ncbi:hypothetical protein [Micromonospora sp. LHW51205]|uniref:hypothetical protein n=1 Tax=Micromonospora sp. LHW51205 TaxID=2248752 RepID=UPI0011BE9340|nr:hypothetical protein [Micromonospora sp. LHW51205]
MRARHALVCVALVGALAGCGGTDEPAAPAPAKSGAQQAVDAIAAKWPAPNPRDTSDGCRAKEGDTAKGCESRVTTDAVTVLEFADEATAARWAKELGKAGDTRQAGRYVLSWTAREQDLTSDEARAGMVAIVKAI